MEDELGREKKLRLCSSAACKPVIVLLSTPGWYVLRNIPDSVYYLRAAAFPATANLHFAPLPGEKLLLGNHTGAVSVHHGQVTSEPDLVLHPPRLTDPPLVMGLPLL